MGTRYITGAMFAILGGLLVVVGQAFSSSAVVVSASGRAVTSLTFALALPTVGCHAGLSLNEVATCRLSVGLANPGWLPGGPLREPVVQHRCAA